MSNGEDWLLRPVKHGYCKYESLVDGTLSLDDVANMNEMIDVEIVNQHRATQAAHHG